MQKSEDGEWYLEVEASGPGGKTTKRLGLDRIDKTPPNGEGRSFESRPGTRRMYLSALLFPIPAAADLSRQRVSLVD